MTNPIAAPAGFVPLVALATGTLGGAAAPVDPNNPVPVGGTALDDMASALGASVNSLPPFAPQETSPLLFKQITPNTSGPHTLVPAGVTGSTIRLYALLITNAADVTVTLVGDSALGNLPLRSRTSGLELGEQLGGLPIYVTDEDADLEVSLSGNVQCEITAWYTQSVPTP